MLGSPHYMSFEQLNGARDIDARSDVYSFGVILYQALTGRTPYAAETLGGLAVQIATTTPARPSELSAWVSSGLDDVVMRALARDRDARLPSLEAFIHALGAFRHGCGSSVGASAPLPRPVAPSLAREGASAPAHGLPSCAATRTRSPRALLWRRVAALAAAAGLLVCVGLAAMLQRRSVSGAAEPSRADAVMPAPAASPPQRSPAEPGSLLSARPDVAPPLESTAARSEHGTAKPEPSVARGSSRALEPSTAQSDPGAALPHPEAAKAARAHARARQPDKPRSPLTKPALVAPPPRPVVSEPGVMAPATRGDAAPPPHIGERRYRAGKPSLDEF